MVLQRWRDTGGIYTVSYWAYTQHMKSYLEFSNYVQTTSRPQKPLCTNFQPFTSYRTLKSPMFEPKIHFLELFTEKNQFTKKLMILEFSNHAQTTSRPEKPLCTNFHPSTPISKFGQNLLPTLRFAPNCWVFEKIHHFVFSLFLSHQAKYGHCGMWYVYLHISCTHTSNEPPVATVAQYLQIND